MTRHARKQTGFTLLELIVALAISSLLALMGAGALSNALDFYNRNAARSEAREDVRATERILRHEWASRSTSIRSDGMTLEFDTLHAVAQRPPDGVALAHVRYACEPSVDGLKILTHRVTSPVPRIAAANAKPPQPLAFEETRVLATDLQVCAFSFLAPSPQSPADPPSRWVQSWDDKRPAPDLMRLALSSLRKDMPPAVYKARTGATLR